MKGRAGLLSFSLLMRPRHFFFRPSPPPSPQEKKKKTTTTKKLAPAMQAMIGPTLERLCMGQCKEREWRGRTRGGGDKGLCVLH